MRCWNVGTNDDQRKVSAAHLFDISDDIVFEFVEERLQVITSGVELQKEDVFNVSVAGDLLSKETDEQRGTRLAIDQQE